MSDQDLRELERTWRESRAMSDWLAWARAAARTGHDRPLELRRVGLRLAVLDGRRNRLEPEWRVARYVGDLKRIERIREALWLRFRRLVGAGHDQGWLPPDPPGSVRSLLWEILEDREPDRASESEPARLHGHDPECFRLPPGVACGHPTRDVLDVLGPFPDSPGPPEPGGLPASDPGAPGAAPAMVRCRSCGASSVQWNEAASWCGNCGALEPHGPPCPLWLGQTGIQCRLRLGHDGSCST